MGLEFGGELLKKPPMLPGGRRSKSSLRRTPIIAINAILYGAPEDIAGRCIAAKAANRLREARYTRPPTQGHSEILDSSFSSTYL